MVGPIYNNLNMEKLTRKKKGNSYQVLKRVPATLSSILIVMDLEIADDGRRDIFQSFQSIASMCFTSECFPWLTGVITNPPPENSLIL